MRNSLTVWLLAAAAALCLPAGVSAQTLQSAQTFQVDFSWWTGPPLVKDKFGVYQTPFFFKAHPPSAYDMTGLLRDAGVRDLRYEMGWGKPDTFAFDQISGPAASPKIDWTRLDPFLMQLRLAGVTPLLAMTYDSLPLKTGMDWQRWKDMPSSLDAWRQINRRYAAHYRSLGLSAPQYEMWNEPDLPGDGGKVFFNGNAADYGRLFAAGAAGIHAGDPDAAAGGPATAWMPEYAQAMLSAAGPDGSDFASNPDFVSTHGYGNYPVQLRTLRGVVQTRPALPLLLTEYASFSQFGLHAPSSRHQAAALFFRDVRGLLAETDVPKVYWAQWIDDALGMVTSDLHRKALFNAYKIYQTLLPVDRSAVVPDGADGVGVMAASDPHTAGVVLWNEGTAARTVTVNLKHLPFARGVGKVYRIDGAHASYIDDSAAEALRAGDSWPVAGPQAAWTGTVPAESVVYLHVSDASGRSLLRPMPLGKVGKSLHWYADRTGGGWSDFDARTGIARLGTGDKGRSAPLFGTVIDYPASCWQVWAVRRGAFSPQNADRCFGLRIDYGIKSGGYEKSVLWYDGSDQAARTAVLPWGMASGPADVLHREKGLASGAAFRLEIAQEAPPDWNHRILITPILQGAGPQRLARLIFLPVK